MKLDKLANSKNDEFYTPEYAIIPLLKYLKPKSIIWCPFDLLDSNYVKCLQGNGHTVIATHLKNDEDFFTIKTPKCDYIISNPPYSCKFEVFEKLFSLGIPFAMLVGLSGLFESKKRFQLFKENIFEIMYFNLRVSYTNIEGNICKSINPPFPSVYVCSNLLPKQIVFETINKTKPTNKK